MTDYDVIILGGGPAGMSALIWCYSLGLRGVLLERAQELGGQMLLMFHNVIDYPGLPGFTGVDIRDRFVAHLDELRLEFRVGCNIEEANLLERLVHSDGQWIKARAMIIATGARKRKLGIPGEDKFEIHGVSYSATRDHSLYAGKKVSVIGGGDSAVESSLMLSRICPRVTLIHHSNHFRARPEWLSEAQQTPNITIITDAVAIAIEGLTQVERLIIEDARTHNLKEIETEGIFIRVGIAPNTEMFRGQIDMDDLGYIRVDSHQRSSLENVYAIGDVIRPVCLSVATAAGHAATAAKEILLSFAG